MIEKGLDPLKDDWARVHPKTVYRWIHDGRLNAFQLGRRTYRVPEPEVRRFLKSIGFAELLPPTKLEIDR